MGEFKSKKIRVNGNRHEVAVVVNTENQNNVSRKKVGQKLVTRQNENPEHVAGKAVPGFWISFPFDTAKRILNIYDYVWCFVVF